MTPNSTPKINKINNVRKDQCDKKQNNTITPQKIIAQSLAHNVIF